MFWPRILLSTLVLAFVFAATTARYAGAQVQPTYLDDRSGPIEVLGSLINAINRGEYARAYSYWDASSPVLQPYAEFAAGYASTLEVELSTGLLQSDAGAGHVYYSVPVTLRSRLMDGTTQTFVGCYVLHLAQPALQSPPFRPLSIRSADLRQGVDDADPAELLDQACTVHGSLGVTGSTHPSVGVSGPGQPVDSPSRLISGGECRCCNHCRYGLIAWLAPALTAAA
jgi:hypothetical protein